MKKLIPFILAITLLVIPGIVFCQEVAKDTITKEVPDTLQQQIPVTPAEAIPEKTNNDAAKKANDANGWGVSLKAGTLGIGLELIRRQSAFFTFRLGGTYLAVKSKNTDTEFGIEKTYNFDLSAVTLIADWFILGNLSGFHVSAGVAYNMTNVEITGIPINKYSIGSYEIPPSQMGDVAIKLIPNEFTPYLGVGFGKFITNSSKLTFNVQLGVLYQGSPKVEFVATGMIEPTSEQADLVAKNIEDLTFYPVLDFQLVYRIK